MKPHYLILLIAVMLFSAGCEKEPQAQIKDPVPLKLPTKASEIITRSNGFGIDLFRMVSQAEDKNLMLSPLSASTALTLLLNGCNNDTYDQIRLMLGFEDQTTGEINATYRSLVEQLLNVDPEVKLALANAVFYRNSFQVHQTYFDTMDLIFDAHIEALDFGSPAALNTINGWAKGNTFGKIEKVLDEISPDAVMFLMNALYFKGTWTFQFDKDLTAPGSFYPDNGSTVEVDMMRGTMNARVFSESGYTVLEMTYGRQNFSMIVIVPTGTLAEFMQDFTGEKYDHITSMLDGITSPPEYEVVMPKFKFDYEKVLNDQLRAMGMEEAFDPIMADLSGISDQSIFVSFVKQNTFVEVNEEGTEAAAVTTIGIELTSAGPELFTVDKPFIFAIRERTSNTLLFIGKVQLPEW